MRNLVTGGAGFIGSHLIDFLMSEGEEVICLDNLSTGSITNIETWEKNPRFDFLSHDVIEPLNLKIDKIWHFACPASTLHYQSDPIKTSITNFNGTFNMLKLATLNKARLFFASTSEVYGNTLNNELFESNWGSTNPNGVRSCYSEGKRLAESLCLDFARCHGTEIRIARIFNAYGPRMRKDDGRLIPNLLYQALDGKNLSVFGTGEQSRSFCYIEDLVKGIIKLMKSNYQYPINLGNPNENYSILQIAYLIKNKFNNKSKITFHSLPKDDPLMRKPSIKIARNILDWEPKINIQKGIDTTSRYIKGRMR